MTNLTKLDSLKTTNNLQAMRSLRPMQALRPLPSLTNTQTYRPALNVMNNKAYADSYADVLLGGVYGTAQLQNTLEKNNLEFLKNVPLLNKAVGVLALTKNQFIDPVLDKGMEGFIDVGLNTLINASETLDIFANVVKSQVPTAGGHIGLDSLTASLGLDGQERKIYNADTGSFIGDMLVEICLDPLNWVSLGATTAMSLSADVITKSTREITEATIRANMVRSLDGLTDFVTPQALDDIATTASKRLAKDIVQDNVTKITYKDLLPALKPSTINELDDLAKQLPVVSTSDILDKSMSDALTKISISNAKHIRNYKAAKQFKDWVDVNIEKPLTKLAYANVVYPYEVLKKIKIKDFANGLHNKIVANFKKYVDLKPTTNISKALDVQAEAVFTATNNYLLKQIQEAQQILYPLEVSVKKIQYSILKFLRTQSKALFGEVGEHADLYKLYKKIYENGFNNRQIDAFARWLVTELDPTTKKYNKTQLQMLVKIFKKDFPEFGKLINVLAQGPFILHNSEMLLQLNDVVSYTTKALAFYKEGKVAQGVPERTKNVKTYLWLKEQAEKATSPREYARYTKGMTTVQNKFSQEDVDNLTDVLNASAGIPDIDTGFIKKIEKSTIKHFKKDANKLDQLKYLDKVILVSGIGTDFEKYYGIANLPEFIKEVFPKMSYQQRAVVAQILRDLGITLDNYKVIADIVNSNKIPDNKKFGILAKVVKRTASDPKFLDAPFLSQLSKDSAKRSKSRIRTALGNFFKSLANDDLVDLYAPNSLITNLQDMIDRIKSNKNLNIDSVLNYLSDILKPTTVNNLNAFTDSRSLHRDVKAWANVLLDEDLKTVQSLIKYIESTEQLLEAVVTDKQMGVDDLTRIKELLLEWYNNMEPVYVYATNVKQSLLQNYKSIIDTPLYKSIFDFVENTISVIEALNNTALSESAVNYLDDLDNIMHLQLSHRGMFDAIMQHTNLSNSNRKIGNFTQKQVMQELVNPNSYARTVTIPKLITLLKEAGYDTYAEEVQRLMAQIDMTVALQKLVTTDIYLDALTEQQSDYVINLLFDALRNSKLKMGDLVDNPKAFDEILESIKKNIYKYMNPIEQTSNKGILKFKKVHRVIQYYPNSYNTIDIIIKEDATVDDIFRYLYGKDFFRKNSEDVLHIKIHEAYMQLLQEGWTRQDIKDLFIYPEDCRMFLAYIGNEFALKGDAIDCKQTLLNAFAKLQQAHQLNDEVMNRTVLALNVYIKDISHISLADFPIYSLYSLESINAINRITANYPKLIVELSKPNAELVAVDTTMEFLDAFAEAIQEGLDVVIRDTKKMSAYLDYADIKKRTYEEIARRSIFDASVESCRYAVKNVVNEITDAVFKLDSKLFKGTNTEYVMLNNRLSAIINSDWLDIDVITQLEDESFVAVMRESLIRTYSRPGALFELVDAEKYFNELSPQNLYCWHLVTKGNLSKTNKRYYIEQLSQLGLQYKVDMNKVTSELFENLEKIGEHADYISDDAFTPVINTMQTMEYGKLNTYIDSSFLKVPRSAETLGEYRYQVTKLVKEDVDSKNEFFQDMQDLESQDILKTDSNAKHTMYTQRKLSLSKAVAEMNAEELAVYIKRNTPGVLIYDPANTLEVITKEGVQEWSENPNVFKHTTEELAAVGLEMRRIENYYVIGIVDPNLIPDLDIKYVRPTYSYEKEQGMLTKILEKLIRYFNLDDMDIPVDMLVTESLPKDLWIQISEDPAFKEFFDKVQEVYQNSTFFNKSYSRINGAIIGGYNALERMQARYAVSSQYVHYSTDIVKNTVSGTLSFMTRANRTKKYISLFFNSDFSAGSALFSEALQNATDEEIDLFFKQQGYRSLILRVDDKGLPKVYDYYIFDKKSLKSAIKDGAIIVPEETATAIKRVVNNRQLSYNAWSLYQRLIPPLYKGLYLLTAGFPVRNFIDSVIYKNTAELGLSLGVKSNLTAIRMLKFHDDIQKQVFDITQNQTFDKKTLLKVLENYTEDEQRVYFLVDMFVTSSASSGYSKTFKEYLEQYNKMDDVRKAWEITWNDRIVNGDASPIKIMNDINNQIEQTARLGLFLGSLDSGLTVSEAINKVNMTHINYSNKTPVLEILENIFWFSTFPLNNLSYYLNHGLFENPMLLRTLVDTQTVSWNSGDYSYEELKKTKFLSYHAMTGNLRLGNYIFKLNPSLFDMIGLMTDPVGNITDRLNPFLSIPFDAMQGELDVNSLSPFNTQVKNLDKFLDGNPIPSLLAFIEKDNRAWLNKNRYNTYTRWTKYPRIKPNKNLMHKYTPKYYAKHYRWWHYKKGMTGLNLQQHGMNVIDPRYLSSTRAIRAVRKFKTQNKYIKA